MVKISIIYTFVFLLFACSKKDTSYLEVPENKQVVSNLSMLKNPSKSITRQLVLMNKCEDEEVVSDLSHSAESLRESLKKDGIELIYQKDSSKCGYELKNNNKSKMLEGAMTDVELYSEIKFFFNLGN